MTGKEIKEVLTREQIAEISEDLDIPLLERMDALQAMFPDAEIEIVGVREEGQ